MAERLARGLIRRSATDFEDRKMLVLIESRNDIFDDSCEVNVNLCRLLKAGIGNFKKVVKMLRMYSCADK